MVKVGSSLIGLRDPRLGKLLALWQARHDGDALPALGAFATMPESLSSMFLTLVSAPDDAAWRVARSGDVADAAYGAELAGQPVARLSPGSDDAEHEAESVAATGHPLVIENDLVFLGRKKRVARLYLPLAADGDGRHLLCGVAVIE